MNWMQFGIYMTLDMSEEKKLWNEVVDDVLVLKYRMNVLEYNYVKKVREAETFGKITHARVLCVKVRVFYLYVQVYVE